MAPGSFLHLIWDHQVLVAAAFAAMSAYPVWRFGARPERTSLTILLAAIAATFLTRSLIGRITQDQVQELDAVIGAIACGLLILIAVRANRIYPMVMAAGQTIAGLAHLLKAFDLIQGRIGYLVPVVGGAYIALAALWVGTLVHARRVKREGPYPDWIG